MDGKAITTPKTPRNTKELGRGQAKLVVGIIDANDVCASNDFLRGLDTQAQAQFKAKIERYCEVGFLHNPKEIRIIQESGDVSPRVHEIKVRSGYRLFGVVVGHIFYATHGVKKPPKKKVAQHAERARRAFITHQEQDTEGETP